MRYLIILWHVLILPLWGTAQVCGLEDTLWINPNTTHTFPIQISGLVNNNLADTAQGICGIEIEFVHQYVENLELWITSPGGTMVQLIGPNTDDPLAFTFFARWDISFVPCSATAMPDLGYAAQWNNDQILNFVSGGRYTGSYYPFSGCLEDFNSGPVNGTWTITVVNDPSPFYGGAILDFRLVFCDDRGVDCCLADAGFFSRPPNLITCQGADTLASLNLPPSYPGRRPDSTIFGYYYVVAQNDTITAYDTVLDLSARPPGAYTVCGLSYELAAAGEIPPLSHLITIDSLRSNLESFSPAFCGELTPVCATIVIVAPPDTTLLSETVCFGDTVFIGNTSYYVSGIYMQNLEGVGGCDSTVLLDLNVLPLQFTTLDTTICAGDSIVIGDTAYYQAGFYFQVLSSSTGCDSIVQLNLDVIAPVTVLLDTAICIGDTVIVGGSRFWQTGVYAIPLSSFQGCDSTVVLNLTVWELQAAITVPDTLTCYQPQITLDGSGSLPVSDIRRIWRNASGDSIGASPTLVVTQQGWYILEIGPAGGFPACIDRDSVWVPENKVFPAAIAGPDSTLTCAIPILTLGDLQFSPPPQVVFNWSTDAGAFSSSNGLPTITATGAGRYILTALDTINGCLAADTLVLSIDTLAPIASAGPDVRLTCAEPSIMLSGSSMGNNLNFLWTGPCITGTANQAAIEVNCGGAYILRVSDPVNACIAYDTTLVVWDTIHPVADAGPPQTLTCNNSQVTLQGSITAGGNNILISWTGPGIISGTNALSCIANEPGLYTLTLLEPGNGCMAQDTVVVSIDTLAPVSDAGLPQQLNCRTSEVPLGGAGTSIGPLFRYSWISSGGNITGPNDQAFTTADTGGVYILIVENTGNGCVDTSNVAVSVDRSPPLANAGDIFVLDCQVREALLDGSQSASGPGITYEWTGPCFIGPSNAATAIADCPGLFTLTVTNQDNGCSASDTTSVLLAQATALALLPDTLWLSCSTGTVQIDGSASVYGVFDWMFNGAPVNIATIDPIVDTPGVYVLNVNTLALNCPDSDTTVVILNCFIEAHIAEPDTLTCIQTTITLNGENSSTGPGVVYQWEGPSIACIATGQGTPQVQVVCPGVYQLVVSNTFTGISDTARVTVVADQMLPVADAGPIDTITCTEPFGLLNGTASSTGPRYRYTWTDAQGNLISAAVTDTVTLPGGYFLEVTDTVNGCSAVDFVTISTQTDPPAVNFGNAIFPCNRDSFLLRAFADPPGLPYAFSWVGPGIISGSNSAEIWIDTAGLYIIQVSNTITGCSATDSVTVILPNCGPCIQVAPPDTITCLVEEVALQVSFCAPCSNCAISWTTVSGEIIAGGNTLNPRVRAGAYTIAVTDTTGITATLTVQVPANNQPPAADAGPDRTINCRDSSVVVGGPNTASGPGLRYQWLVPPGAMMNPSNLPMGSANRPGDYVLLVRDSLTGCQSADTVRVFLDTLIPVAEAGPDKVITCAMAFATPDGSGSTLGSSISYLWTATPPGFINAGETTLNPIVTTPGIYRIQVTNTLNGCTASDSMRVTLSDQLPFVPDIPNQALTCRDSILLINPVMPDTSGLRLQWCRVMGGNIFVDCSEGLTRNIHLPGVYRFEVTDTLTGCRNIDFFNVEEDKTPPQVDAGNAPGVLSCTQLSLLLNGAAGPAGAPLQLEWTALGGSMIAPNNVLNPRISTPDIYVLTVTRLDNGCRAEDSVEVRLNDNFPVAIAGPDTALTCRITEMRLQAAAQTTGNPVQWAWSTVDGQILDGATTPTPRINRPGSYVLRITDPANGCTDSDTIIVFLDRNPPDIQITGPEGFTLTCTLNSLVLDASATIPGTGSALRFQWFGAPGSISGSADSSSIRVSGVGFYRLIAEDVNNGCRDTTLVQIGGNFDAPTVSIASPLPITCARTTVELLGLSFPSDSFIRYQWILPSGDTILAAASSWMADIPGLYRLLAEDTRNGCRGTASQLISQDVLPPLAVIAPPDTIDCGHPSISLNGAASRGRGMLSYQWTGPPGGILGGAGTPEVSVAQPGAYSLILTDAFNGCRDTAEVQVVQLSAPITGLALETFAPSCRGDADGEILLAEIQGGTGPYTVAFNGGSPSNTRSFTYLPAGIYPLRIRDALGCSFDTVAVLQDPALLTVDLGPDRFIQLGDSIRLEALTNLPVMQYRWAPSALFIHPEDNVQMVRPQENTTYQVTVIDENGCTATDWITVWVNTERLFFVPNAFSPNGDGHNDKFVIFGGPAVKAVHTLKIFDRWGNMVFSRNEFQPNDPSLGWDGTFGGKSLNPSVFVVIAELELWNGRLEQYKGELTLLR